MPTKTSSSTRPTTPDLPHVDTEAGRNYDRLLSELKAAGVDHDLVVRSTRS